MKQSRKQCYCLTTIKLHPWNVLTGTNQIQVMQRHVCKLSILQEKTQAGKLSVTCKELVSTGWYTGTLLG